MIATNSSNLIHLATLEYPVSLWVMKSRFPLMAFGENVAYETLAELGYAEVIPVEQPVGDVVTEGTPVLIGEQWTQVWNIRNYSPEELADLLESAKSSAAWSAMDAFTITQEAGVECVFAAGNVNMRLNSGTIAALASDHDPLIMGSNFKVVTSTPQEAAAAYTLLRAKRQLLLAEFVTQKTAIDSTAHYLSIPSDEDIRTAISNSVL